MVHSETFQYIMAEKYNIQIIFYKMTRSFAYATAQIVLSSR